MLKELLDQNTGLNTPLHIVESYDYWISIKFMIIIIPRVL